jgi:hypothetical protein
VDCQLEDTETPKEIRPAWVYLQSPGHQASCGIPSSNQNVHELITYQHRIFEVVEMLLEYLQTFLILHSRKLTAEQLSGVSPWVTVLSKDAFPE